MPTSDRRPRARRKSTDAVLTGVALLKAMHDAIKDSEAWSALRPQAIRAMTTRTVTAEVAGRIFDAYGRKPLYMPRLPPGADSSNGA